MCHTRLFSRHYKVIKRLCARYRFELYDLPNSHFSFSLFVINRKYDFCTSWPYSNKVRRFKIFSFCTHSRTANLDGGKNSRERIENDERRARKSMCNYQRQPTSERADDCETSQRFFSSLSRSQNLLDIFRYFLSLLPVACCCDCVAVSELRKKYIRFTRQQLTLNRERERAMVETLFWFDTHSMWNEITLEFLLVLGCLLAQVNLTWNSFASCCCCRRDRWPQLDRLRGK